jgi:hypothetical protein
MNDWEFRYNRIEGLDDHEWEVFSSELSSWLYFRFEDDIWDQIVDGSIEDSAWEDYNDIWESRPTKSIKDLSEIQKDVLVLKFTDSGEFPSEAWNVICKAVELNLSGWNDYEYGATLENIEELKSSYGPARISATW